MSPNKLNDVSKNIKENTNIKLLKLTTELNIAHKEKPTDSEEDLLIRLINAEASGEGIIGMALVANSIINRYKIINSKASKGKRWKNIFITHAKHPSLTAVIYGKDQYTPITNNKINQKILKEDYNKAKEALALAKNRIALEIELLNKNINYKDIYFLIKATGFRTLDAKKDISQNINNVIYKKHKFTTAGNPLD